MTAGYSGTPLAKKLSLRDGQRVWFDAMPEDVIDEMRAAHRSFFDEWMES